MTAMTERKLDAFEAFRVHVDGDRVRRGVETVEPAVLPPHDVVVAVRYSSVNYKDALSAGGNRGVTKSYPHTPGIDAAGTVVSSADGRFAPGDEVICTGFDLGMNTPGGYATYIRVPGDWLVRRPPNLSARDAMAIGTAGLTAALALDRLADAGVTPELGPLVVTGASGGVGSLAVWLGANAGYEVVASTGTPSSTALLTSLGAARVSARQELEEPTKRPLLSAEFAGGVDTVGGTTLANLLKRTAVGGAVAACGLVGGSDLPTTVFPFILRGVALMGVDSQHAALATRERAWDDLAAAAASQGGQLAAVTTEIALHDLDAALEDVLAGRTVGRLVVRVAGD